MLALLDAVFTADADACVLRALLVDIGDLEIIGFLDAEDQRILVGEHRGCGFFAEIPGIVTVFGDAEADVVGDDFEGFRLLGAGTGDRQQGGDGSNGKDDFFHMLWADWFPTFKDRAFFAIDRRFSTGFFYLRTVVLNYLR